MTTKADSEIKCEHCGAEYKMRTIQLLGKDRNFKTCLCTAEAIGDMEAEKQYVNRLKFSGLSAGLLSETMLDWVYREGTEKIIMFWSDVHTKIDVFISDEENNSFLLMGSNGSGKTKIATDLFKKALRYTRGRAFKSADLVFKSRTWMFNPQEYRDDIKMLCETPLLFIDDLAQMELTKEFRVVWYKVFDHRLENRMPTFLTTHRNREEMTEILGAEVVSRIKGLVGPNIYTTGKTEDYRWK